MAVLIIFILIAFVAIILFIGKKLCDMAIKTEIAKQYAMLIFTPEQREAMDKISKEAIEWLQKNSSETEIISRDGLKLKGYEIIAEKETNIWVILVHGYMNKGLDMVHFAKKFQEYGYNNLIIDQRALGKSEGKYMGMGWLEHYDLQLWIQKIIEEHKNSKIILFGLSMGAATVSITTGKELPKEVKLAIADCGYTSVWEEFKVHLRKIFHIVPFPLLYSASIMSKIYAGYTFKEASSIRQVRKSKTPTLFIHGKKDKFVPFYMLDKIYENAACEKEKLEIEEAGHGESSEINPEKYWGTIRRFIEKYI